MRLKGTLLAFFQKLFGAERKIQLVCNYFVEPGARC